ncbi:MAG: hypothetical protein AAB270_01785 [Chloroflexota bacterium]
MSRTTMGFIFTALAYLVIGTGLGAYMAIAPGGKALQPVHAHLNLVGFVMFTVFGIAYHILPRFRGRPLHSEGMAWVQLWLANAALVGFELSTVANIYWGVGGALRGVFGAALALSFYLFVYNIGRTLLQPPPPPPQPIRR